MLKLIKDLQIDRKQVFDTIQKQGPISKGNIQLRTNLKLTTLNRVINELEVKKLILDYTTGESTGGRKPKLYDVNYSGFYVVGIDISRTYTQIVLTNLKMMLLKEKRFAMDEGYSAEKTLDKIIYTIYSFINELKIDKEQIVGLGIGTVGPLDRKKGKLLNPINFPGDNWNSISIKEYLKNKLEIPIIIDNGANTAALGEYFYGEGKGYDNIAYINCGIGIRTGVITSGKIIRAINDREDAFGHMVIDIDGEPCYCGNYGCVESYSSIYSIVKKFKDELKKERITFVKKDIREINFLDIFIAADEGDIVARDVVTNSALLFGAAIANYINLLNPQLIILSGPSIYNSHLFYKISTETALKRINNANTNIRFSKGGYFKENAIALGAASMVVETCLGKL
jgi:predicted NBD/HSP70 family sugar kinase